MLLYIAHWPALYPPLRETLPAVFDGVSMAPGEPDEDLYDERGRRLELATRRSRGAGFRLSRCNSFAARVLEQFPVPRIVSKSGRFTATQGNCSGPVRRSFPSGAPRRGAPSGGLGGA